MRALIIASLFCGLTTFGEDIYIAQTAQGGNTGVDAANAHSAAWFNSAANWGAGTDKISPGDTAHLVGTITNQLEIQAGGTAGSPTTILFESGAKIIMPALPITGAIRALRFSHLIIDGGTDGRIEGTDNGTELGNMIESRGVQIESSGTPLTNIIVRNLTITNVLVRTQDHTNTAGMSAGMYLAGSLHAFQVYNCAVSQAATCIQVIYANELASNDLQIYSNTLTHCNWGVDVGQADVNTAINNVSIHHNRIINYGNWDQLPAISHHHNGIFVRATAAGTSISNAVIYANTIGPYIGAAAHNTAMIYLSASYTNIFAVIIYNNTLYTLTNAPPGNGFVNCTRVVGGGIFNNTLDANGQGGLGIVANQGTNLVVQNNIISGTQYPIYALDQTTQTLASVDFECYGAEPTIYWLTGAITYANWRVLGYDAYSFTNSPSYVDAGAGNFHLAASSILRGAGTNLNALFTEDLDGVVRGTAWDIGAYEYAADTGNISHFGTVQATVARTRP